LTVLYLQTCLTLPAEKSGISREAEFALKQAEHPKTVVIAGGGMAGMEAAITLKLRGHNPILCEATDHLGGQFLLAGVAPRKEEMRAAAISRAKQVEAAGVDIRLSTPVTPELLQELSPDAVILAVGAVPLEPPIPGIDLPT